MCASFLRVWSNLMCSSDNFFRQKKNVKVRVRIRQLKKVDGGVQLQRLLNRFGLWRKKRSQLSLVEAENDRDVSSSSIRCTFKIYHRPMLQWLIFLSISRFLYLSFLFPLWLFKPVLYTYMVILFVRSSVCIRRFFFTLFFFIYE